VRSNLPPNHYLQAACEDALGQALVQRGRPEDREEAVRLLVDGYRAIRDRRGAEFHRTKRALGRLAGRSGIGTLMSHEQQLYLQHPAIREALREGIDQSDDAALLKRLASAMIRYEGFETAHYELALRAARRANELAPNDAAIVRSVGVARYRAGHYEEAIPTVTRADALAVEAGLGEQPDNWAFIAMAHHQLGCADEARVALQRLRKLLEDPDNAGNAEYQDFFREAVELIETGAGDPG
jgi:tetratricopeptide (TPR) repeat protein